MITNAELGVFFFFSPFEGRMEGEGVQKKNVVLTMAAAGGTFTDGREKLRELFNAFLGRERKCEKGKSVKLSLFVPFFSKIKSQREKKDG
jgi:hypothetical protein